VGPFLGRRMDSYKSEPHLSSREKRDQSLLTAIYTIPQLRLRSVVPATPHNQAVDYQSSTASLCARFT
jgi:hypothetical protein